LRSKTIVTLHYVSLDCHLVKAVKDSLEPDNLVAPRNMKVVSKLVEKEGFCEYILRVEVSGEALLALKRANATINEVLLILNSLLKASGLRRR